MKSLRTWFSGLRSPPVDTVFTPPAEKAITVERPSVRLSDLSHESLRDLIGNLGQRADRLGCVAIDAEADHACAVVIFAGNVERFHMLSVAQYLSCKIIYLQDLQSGWYQGSEHLPDLQTLCRDFLPREIGKRPALFFGQSSGGYAALAASTYFPGSTVVACGPQTHSDAVAKAKINFVGVRPLPTPDGLVDIKARLIASADPDTSTTIVIAVSEADNPVHAHFWMDYLHALRVSDLPNVSVSIVNSNSHAIVHGNLRAFAGLLRSLTDEISAPAERRTEITREFLRETFGKE